jgi:tRNA (guanine37-N1)-methyltransferase
MFQGPLSESLLKKAQEKGLLSLNIIDIRDFTADKHKTADDTPYGGGPGMVMKPDPIFKAVARNQQSEARIVLMCPTGKLLTHNKIKQLANEKHLIVICGHYEGIDERVREMADEEISIGDYVLTGGEIPAMVLADAVARQIPGIVKEEESVRSDSFYAGVLGYPSYTKPEEYEGKKVPEILLSGHHAKIERWRKKEALRRTLERRPDLLAKAELSGEEKLLLSELFSNE